MPFFTGDYLRDTRHLSMCEHGAYFLALTHCWDSKGPMPLDERKQFAIVCARSSDEMEAWRRVRGEFFVLADDGWYQPRMAQEVAKSERLSATFREAGLKSAAVRRTKARDAKSEPRLNLGSTDLEPRSVSPSPSPSPSLNTTHTANAVCVPDGAAGHPAEPAQLDCPHEEILRLWAEELPQLPQHNPEQWGGTRAVHLRTRWRETAAKRGWRARADGLEYFRRLFRFVGQSEFLTGRAGGKRPFLCELAWLVKPENWVKVHEGKYHEAVKV